MLLSLVVAMGAGCADDAPVTTGGQGTSTGPDPSPITFTMEESTGGTTDVADDTGTGSSGPADTTTTGEDTTTGGEALPGPAASQLVSAGERASSPGYTLVYTLGQPSSLQSTHQSANYRIQGGLIGANGSPP